MYTIPTEPLKVPTCNPRPGLAPLEVAPSMVTFDPASIPEPQLQAFKDCQTHTTSLHFTPAAFPRCASTPGQIELVPDGLKGRERKQWVAKHAMALVKEKRALERDLSQGQGKIVEGPERVVAKIGLWNAVLRIKRRKRDGEKLEGVEKLTLVVTHANGLHKETWEVPMRRLIDLTEQSGSRVRIEEIWVLECVDHGDSALANGPNHPRLADRSDYGRDVANFCLHYLPDRDEALPRILVRVDDAVAQRRKQSGLAAEGRSLVGVGHSLGGDSMVLCGISYPGLFKSLVISETTIFPVSTNNNDAAMVYVGGALGRRGAWSSREEARAALGKTPMYSAWQPQVFDSYISHALYEDKINGGVRLKCGPESETRQFNEFLSMNEAYEKLPMLDEKVALHWIMGGDENASVMYASFYPSHVELTLSMMFVCIGSEVRLLRRTRCGGESTTRVTFECQVAVTWWVSLSTGGRTK
ncbi:hypothetical protein CC2G_004882 [Coprinopsis cinerea AmutBmut pab1-1]|nr:hypothetical protein CC2G_004882 [Coprinopsis cinerea AmutBmut pab1-1]